MENVEGRDYVPLSDYRILQRENATPKGTILKMEGTADMLNVKMGQNNRSRKNWMQLDFENENKVKEYIKEVVHPHLPYPPHKWIKYSVNSRTLCTRVMTKVVVPQNCTMRGYWDRMIGGIVNTAYINLRSNTDKMLLAQFKSKKL